MRPANTKNKRALGILACAAIVLSPSMSAGSEDVYWAGFAYQGDLSAARGRYQHTFRLADPSRGVTSMLDNQLRRQLTVVRNETFNIVFGELGSLGADAPSTIALAFVLNRESTSVERIGSKYKILTVLSAQALFFDFRAMAIVSTYPLSVVYIDSQPNEPTSDDLARLVEALYLGSLKVNIFDEFVKTLSRAKLNTSVSRRIQVTHASVDPAVAAKLPEFWRRNPEDFAAFLSQQFSSSLSTSQDVPVLPYTKGYAIGNRMSARFASGEVFSLTLPEPDYVVSLELEKLVKLKYAEVAAGTSYIYGTYLSVRAVEPLSGRVYIDTTIKNGGIKKVPATQPDVDDWAAYQATLLSLVNEFTAVVGAPERQWAEKHVGNADAVKQLAAFGKVVLSCR